jgi:Flp pilus assembly protein TadG
VYGDRRQLMRSLIPSRRRRGERGQTVPILAVAGVVLIGATALAVDLSLQTHNRRNLQNITDAAALAGAQHLSTVNGLQSDRITGAEDALAVVFAQLTPRFTISGTVQQWAINTVTGSCSPSATSCVVTVPFSTAAPYTITVATPPTKGNFTSSTKPYTKNQYFEVDLTEQSQNGFAGVIGAGNDTEGSHSVALHTPSDDKFGFALYSQQYVSDGNSTEVVYGNMYAGSYIYPQSNGHAAVCAQGGSVVLGAPQYPNQPSGYSNTQVQQGPHPFEFMSDCTGVQNGEVAQSQPEGCSNVNGVSLPANSYTDDGGYTLPSGISQGGTKACVANPAISPPTYFAPSSTSFQTVYGCNTSGLVNGQYQPGIYTCGLVVDHPLAPGVYTIERKNNANSNFVDLDMHDSATLTGVTFVFVNNDQQQSPVAQITQNSTAITQTDYCPSPRTNPGDCVYPFYAAPGVAVTFSLSSNSSWSGQGTIYMPSASFTIGQNSVFRLRGQVLVQNWSNQSGYHPDPNVTYDSSVVAPVQEQLRIVE